MPQKPAGNHLTQPSEFWWTYLMPQLWKPNICYSRLIFFHTQDIIVIPMEFFDLPKTVLLSVLTWLTVLFWSVDMLPLSWSNLTAGYVVRVTNAIFCPQNAKLCWGFPSRLASTGKASLVMEPKVLWQQWRAKQVLQGLGLRKCFCKTIFPPYSNVKPPQIIVKQAIVDSGWFSDCLK